MTRAAAAHAAARRQRLVTLILWAWPVMPRRARLWAFLKDGSRP